MLLSMTGYGRSTGSFGDKLLLVELRALNSKVTDIKMRIPGEYRDKESEIRKIISDHAERGKIDVMIEVQNTNGAANVSLNEPVFKGYYFAVSKLADELGMDRSDLLPAILRIPSVIASQSAETHEEEWETLKSILLEALEAMKVYRRHEGSVLEQDLRDRVAAIIGLLEMVGPYEKERFARMRERMRNNLDEVFGRENIDSNRFEQEVLYYLERMDMSEEKVRLAQHCKYFIEQLDDHSQSAGRTLGFIAQEMGREINTLGAKAYDANIQRFVVQMKDELEKIKEQLANAL